MMLTAARVLLVAARVLTACVDTNGTDVGGCTCVDVDGYT